MDALEFEHRITEVEQRAKSNTHRLDKLEPVVNEIHTMSNTMVQLVEEVKHTNAAVDGLDAKVDKLDSRVDDMERAPAKEWSNIRTAVITAIVTAVVTAAVAAIISIM